MAKKKATGIPEQILEASFCVQNLMGIVRGGFNGIFEKPDSDPRQALYWFREARMVESRACRLAREFDVHFTAGYLRLCQLAHQVAPAIFQKSSGSSHHNLAVRWASGQIGRFSFTLEREDDRYPLERLIGEMSEADFEERWNENREAVDAWKSQFSDDGLTDLWHMLQLEAVQSALVCEQIPLDLNKPRRTSKQPVIGLEPVESLSSRGAKCPQCGGSMPTYKTQGKTQRRKCLKCGKTGKTTKKS
jgi:hypothetical protein